MAGKSELQIKGEMRNGKTGLRRFSYAELASMLHGLLFAYEKVFINLHGDDIRSLYPYILDEMSHILHTGDDPVIDPNRSLEENIDRVLYFISNEEYLKDISFKKLDDGKYVFDVGACSFAKSGVHDILKIKEGICPFALVIASCITELTANGYVRITKSEFDDDGTKVYLETVSEKGIGRDATEMSYMDMDEKILATPSLKSSLDELDLRLIKELRRDGRLSNVELAKVLESSESTVRRRINNLMERGIIKGFTTLLQHPQENTLLRVFISIKVDPKFIDGIAARLAERKDTCSVYKTIGDRNLMCELIMNDQAKFQEFFDELQFVEGVNDIAFYLASSAPKPCPWYGF